MKYSLCFVLLVLVSALNFISVIDAKKKSTDIDNNSKKYEGDFEFIDEVSVVYLRVLTMLQLVIKMKEKKKMLSEQVNFLKFQQTYFSTYLRLSSL